MNSRSLALLGMLVITGPGCSDDSGRDLAGADECPGRCGPGASCVDGRCVANGMPDTTMPTDGGPQHDAGLPDTGADSAQPDDDVGALDGGQPDGGDTGPSCTDATCAPEGWCAETESGDLECRPYRLLGEACGAGDPCQDGLVCLDLAGAPESICSKPCRADPDCEDHEYCGDDEVCRPDGSCERNRDCDRPANEFERLDCDGYAVCDVSTFTCGWACGSPWCRDVSDAEFGDCERIIGWAVLDGACAPISGCDPAGLELFGSERACREECFADGPCTDDGDCREDRWCRPTEAEPGVSMCVPYLGEGRECGGLQPPWAAQRCLGPLVCTDFPPGVEDAPGHCRMPCERDEQCGRERYCATAGICRFIEECLVDADCEQAGNAFEHEDCLGFGLCNADRCSWQCGERECRDHVGIDYGACRVILGWGIVEGTCSAISGCPEQAPRLFDDEESCNAACGAEAVRCNDDGDCPDDRFCRATQEGGRECVPYSEEGDFCGGFAPQWGITRCKPGLICTDHRPFIADAPGRCRRPCDDNGDCADQEYCSENLTCRADSTCLHPLDCDAPGNDYDHIECVGYGVCDDDGSCGYACGDLRCRDLEGVFLGPCDAELGVGVVRGECQAISGCDADGFALFESVEACAVACLPQ